MKLSIIPASSDWAIGKMNIGPIDDLEIDDSQFDIDFPEGALSSEGNLGKETGFFF